MLWLLLIAIVPVFTPLVLTPKSLSLYIRADYGAAIATLGEPDAFNRRLVKLYNATLNGIAAAANEFRERSDDSAQFRDSGDHIGVVIADMPGQWAAMVKLQAYSFALRVTVIAIWLPWLLSPMLAAALAGWLERKLKRDTFVAPRPPVFNTAAHAVIALWFFFLLWLASPIPLAVAAIPALATLLAFSVSLAVAHFPS
jgi:hypothetical protein